VTQDPVDDATWALITAPAAGEGPPGWLFPEKYPPDPEDLPRSHFGAPGGALAR
jgi:hypothetical protein